MNKCLLSLLLLLFPNGSDSKWETWVNPALRDPLEKGVATHSSILVWRIPWTKEPCGLQSLGSQRVEHGLNDTLLLLIVVASNVEYLIIWGHRLFKFSFLKFRTAYNFFYCIIRNKETYCDH